MRLTFHISQMPNVICETNMERDFIFSKNGLLECYIVRRDESWWADGHELASRTQRQKSRDFLNVKLAGAAPAYLLLIVRWSTRYPLQSPSFTFA